MKKLLFYLLGIALFVGCATVDYKHSAYLVEENGVDLKKAPSEIGLSITGEEVNYFSGKYFGMIALNFRNNTDEWIYLKNIDVDFGSPAINKTIFYPIGKEYIAWKNAIVEQKDIDEHNRQAFWGSLAITGILASEFSQNDNIKVAGNVAALTSAGLMAASEYQNILRDVEGVDLFPENHLLSGEIVIPPGFFAKRWILVNSNDETPFIDTISLKYTDENDKEEIAKLRIKNAVEGYRKSHWQSEKNPARPQY